MANTLKFGTDGKWAVKKGSALAYNDENDNFKPLPFTFDRSTSATRVNKQGLIEVVSNNEPRIDFLNDSKGALKLEPSRSNLVTYSEDFTQWGDAGTPTVVLSSSLAPNGSLDAYDITDDNTGVYEIKRSNSASFDGTYTMSIFVKKTTGSLSHYAGIQFIGLSDYLIIDTTNGTVNQTASEYSNIKVEDFSNWWKISATGTNTGSTFLINLWAAISSNGTSLSASATGTNTFYGAQLEQGSYATSYIPTQGSIGTRVAESCVQTPPSGIINSSEGVLYLDLKTSENDTVQQIALTDGTIDERILLEIRNGGTLLTYYVIQGGVAEAIIAIPISAGVYNKVALSYKTNEAKIYVNGVLEGTDVVVTPPTGLDTISFNGSTGSLNVYISLKDLRVYNQVLTDAELQALTTI